MAILTENNIKAELSYAYLHAVAARAGLACVATDRHADGAGVDAVIRAKERFDSASLLTEFTLEIQLKATSRQLPLNDGRYSFRMEMGHYDKLRSTDVAAPRYLAVLMMPVPDAQWLEVTAEQLICRRCVRWVSLRDASAVEQDTVTVYVPETNVLTPEALRELASMASKQEWIGYDV